MLQKKKGLMSLALIVGLIFVIASILIGVVLRRSLLAQASASFENDVSGIISDINLRLNRDSSLIRGVQGLFSASQSVERNEFYAYFEPLDIATNFAGISSVSYVEAVADAEKQQFLADFQADKSYDPSGYPDLNLYPAVESVQHYFVKYVYPEEKFGQVLGFDYNSEKNRLETLERARDTGELVASAQVFSTADNQPSIIIMAPIYKNDSKHDTLEERRQNFVGVILFVLKVNTFFPLVMGEKVVFWENFDFHVYDNESSAALSQENLIYDYNKGNDLFVADGLKEGVKVDFSGRLFGLAFATTKTYKLIPFERAVPYAMAGLGMVVGCLFFFTLFSFSRSELRAEEIAARIAEDLKKTEERYAALYESSSDAIMTVEPPNWNFSSGNPATLRIFGVPDEKTFLSLRPADLSPKIQPDGSDSLKKVLEMMNKAMSVGSADFDWVYKRYNGEEFFCTVRLTRAKWRGKDILQATVRDESEEKKAEVKLAQKLDELERLNRLMVGRELEMVELKKKIKELGNNSK